MKRNQNLTDNLLKQFDKELRAILMFDVKEFKIANGGVLINQSDSKQRKLQVA